jgi:phage terminase small subunit
MELNEKQIRFCEEYIIDLNATQAAIRAGYSEKTARNIATALLSKVHIQAHLQKIRRRIEGKLHISQERVLQEYARIAFSDIRKLYNDSNALLSIQDLDDDAAAAIAGVEVFEEFSGKGENKIHIGNTVKLKMWDKKGALDSICKVMGYNAPDKMEHSGAVTIESTQYRIKRRK